MDSLSQEITIIIVGSVFFLLVAVGIIVLLLIYQKRQLHFILEKQQLSNQFQKELLTTRLEAQEDTLHQLSRELHDNIGQLLSSSKLLIGVTRRALTNPMEELKLAEETVAKALTELRAMSKSLNKDWLERFNFIDNLTAEAKRINATKEFDMTIRHPEIINLPSERQLVLFRIVQEAFQNSLKHGKASHINILVEQKDAYITVRIEDNGNGFDVSDNSLLGVGMINIKNRAQLLGGSAQWQSSRSGTSVAVQIPIQEQLLTHEN
jgi:signal transduction histidine kinase